MVLGHFRNRIEGCRCLNTRTAEPGNYIFDAEASRLMGISAAVCQQNLERVCVTAVFGVLRACNS